MSKPFFGVIAGVLLCALSSLAQARAQASEPYPYASVGFLMGDWIADGPAAAGSGHFEFTPDVQGNVVVRRNHAEYPSAGDRPVANHDDLMVIYREGGATRAIYFDNEGHVIRYAVEPAGTGAVTFLSEAVAGAPRYRLSYRKLPDGRVGGKFEVAPPGKAEEFKTYLEWTAKRKP
jgi:hypothetical protein